MLEPRGADVPALFLVLVVLPLVTYFLLGKWSEASRRKERLGLLAQLVAEESQRGEVMVAASVSPLYVVSPLKLPANVSPSPFLSAPKVAAPASPEPTPFVSSPSRVAFHECARCHAPATTRCSRCKSVRYCSGKCQIIHWRNIHKDECQPIEITSSLHQHASPEESAHGKSFFNEGLYGLSVDNPLKQPLQENTFSVINECASTNHGASVDCASRVVDSCNLPKQGRKSTEKRASHIISREGHGMKERSISSTANGLAGNIASSKGMKNKLKGNDPGNPGDDFCERLSENAVSPGLTTFSREQSSAACEGELGSNYRHSVAFGHGPIGTNVDKVAARRSVDSGSFCKEDGVVSNGEVPHRKSFSDVAPNGWSTRRRSAHHAEAVKISKSKSMAKSSKEHIHNTAEINGHVLGEPSCKVTTLKKSVKSSKKGAPDNVDVYKKIKMLFPYEEFEKVFRHENVDLIPRGLSNCGNSCYANAVLQCLTCTKPLVVYLLKRTHSRSCRVKSWCLMCELEQYVQMLRESGGPLSPSRILSHVRSMNCRLGDGSQEDAHEFLRLLVASMQSICLEEYGGEKRVHPQLQETTFVQHAFGGRLRSKVKCLNCHHQSERCENIMDLTLEIYGWVESLEDALTQFTSPEDLDGENMYKCGRCASYVRARKQLSIDEAPNILTIVLKRFQEGSYGKINKCITFPEMLDMVPFMTGTYDVPPLYMLYGVVVHMDTLNASFSGHYVSYVKDLQGNWLRIDDSEVQPVPVSQVMSEGAYILFYMRSYPRPSHTVVIHKNHSSAKAHNKPSRSNAALSSELPSPSAVESGRTSHHDIHQSANNHRRCTTPSTLTETYPGKSSAMDAASSSDWSLFTSSDEAASSTTTESTRDSFSTNADYSDAIPEQMSSLFSSLYTQEHPASSQRTVSCRMFSGSVPVTRFVPVEVKGYVVDSGDCDPSSDSTIGMMGGTMQMTDMVSGQYGTTDNNPCDFVTYGSDGYYPPMYGHLRTDHIL